MKIDVATFLEALEAVKVGLSPKPLLEQSSHFVFKDGRIVTFNGEVACSHTSPIDVTGAVQADPLLQLLRKKWPKTVEVSQVEAELQIRSKSRSAGITFAPKIMLPLEHLEAADKWKALPPEFATAVERVESCAGMDEAEFNFTCIHITPEWIEAFDHFQLGRFYLQMPIKEDLLVRRQSLCYMTGLDLTRVCLTKNWINFKNKAGVVLSCMRYSEEYPDDLTSLLEDKGDALVLPPGLYDAADAAGVFAAHNLSKQQMQVSLTPGQVYIEGRSPVGWYKEHRKVDYAGRPLKFMIEPKRLQEVVTDDKRQGRCEITDKVLKIEATPFVYITSLEIPATPDIEDKPKKKKKKVARV